MTLARTRCVGLSGLTGSLVEVEADLGNGIPGFIILGLPDASLNEARERIKAAARNTGIPLANRKLTVNLSPATLHKYGSGFDLAIVLAALSADRQIRACPDTVYLAELGLDGMLRPVPGIMPAVMLAVAAGARRVMVSEANAAEAKLVPGAHVHSAAYLGQVLESFGAPPEQITLRQRHREATQVPAEPVTQYPDLAEVHGQHEARAALEVAAAGGHNLLMTGPAGVGKTLLARCLPGILPPLDAAAALEATAIRSITDSGSAGITALQRTAPFIAPHHTASTAALLGGGTRQVMPGAVTRAHHGVLFLDEAPEFATGVLDALRQPLEDGFVTVSRARLQTKLPARFQLVLAANPCPCGRNYGTGIACTCTAQQRRRYFTRLSGPILDRIDLQLQVNQVPPAALFAEQGSESTAQVRQRVLGARQRATARLAGWGIGANAQVPAPILRHRLVYGSEARRKLTALASRADLSARGIDRVLRVSWSIADLAGHPSPTAEDMELAVHLRQKIEN